MGAVPVQGCTVPGTRAEPQKPGKTNSSNLGKQQLHLSMAPHP